MSKRVTTHGKLVSVRDSGEWVLSDAPVIMTPVKTQGRKTKLIPYIRKVVGDLKYKRWLEPFAGSCIVGVNLAHDGPALFSDENAAMILLFQHIKHGFLTADKVRIELEIHDESLREIGEDHYYAVRDRFRETGRPMDFLFLNRTGFNGVVRFGPKGLNVPFCKDVDKLSESLIKTIVDQLVATQAIIQSRPWHFACLDFEEVLLTATSDDLVYLDPPYHGLNSHYYTKWTAFDQRRLVGAINATKARVLLSTWKTALNGKTADFGQLTGITRVIEVPHRYQSGQRKANRGEVVELLICKGF